MRCFFLGHIWMWIGRKNDIDCWLCGICEKKRFGDI